MTKRILLMMVFALAATNVFAANHYIRAGATGANNGTDWTNAWTSLSSANWTRGDVYYIAAGSYSGLTLSAGTSGNTVIEIRGAVGGSGDHGTTTGWSDSFQGQAVLGGTTIATSFWKLNGQAVPGCTYPTDNPSCHLIKINHPGTSDGSGALVLGNGSQVTNITMDYIDVQGSNVHQDGTHDEGIYCIPGPCNQTYIGHSHVHNTGCDTLSFNDNLGDTITVEYSWISYNNFGPTTANHCQGIQSTFGTMILRYNMWQDMQSSAAISLAAGGNGAPIVDWEIYGNVFYWDAAWNAQVQGDGRVGYDDGIVGIFDETQGCCKTGLLKIYNNTIVGLNLSGSQNCNGQAYTINSNEFVSATIYNNIWANFGPNCNAGQAGAGTYDYNAYYQISNKTNDNGAHSYSSSTNPFVNPTAGTVAGFMLTADTQAGLQLSSPYNVDLFGVTRGASGTLDRGALQLNGTSSSLPPVPQGFHVVSIQ
ncbi:MAG: hypothetical protein LAO19_04320 [Acidobacteriia bacterium]|nr:hypothetical protein [Terriglobia bacterium]